jgi:hypothetical protein
MKKVKKILVYLNGGLGNQMFQYALGRKLAEDNTNSELVLDNWSGFFRDYVYKRVYELDALPIKGRIINTSELIIFWLYKFLKKLKLIRKAKIEKLFRTMFINEEQLEFDETVINQLYNNETFILGYWQSYKYFQSIKEQLFKELTPPIPNNKLFIDIASVIKSSNNAVALGVRLYEESLNPAAHALDGKIKSAADINLAIKQLQGSYPDAVFFIFCTHRSNLLDLLDLPENTYYLTHEDGFQGTIERLWLLTQCKHHIFTNSSYYWWGAWLSEANFLNQKQLILAADNFINIDGVPNTWKKF